MVGRYKRNQVKFMRACHQLLGVVLLIHQRLTRLQDRSIEPTEAEMKLIMAGVKIMDAMTLIDEVYELGITRGNRKEISESEGKEEIALT